MNLGFDLTYAWRLLKQSWGYTLLCASVVALSVGLAIWTWSSVTYPQLLRPVGLPGAEDWYTVQIATEAATNPRPGSVDAYTYQELLKNNRTSDHVGAFAWSSGVLSEGQASANLRGGSVSPRLIAQVVPFMGRTFQETDAQPGAAKVVLLSFDTWQNYCAADPAIIGKTVRIDAAPVQVVGVMPKGFFAFEDFEMWRPLQLPKLVRPRDSKVSLFPFIKLRENQRIEAVLNETKATVERVSRDYPEFYNATRYPVVIPAHRTLTYGSTAIVVMFTFISAAVFLLGGLNISLVFLARLLERTRELALRTAIGASRARLLRQCLQETVLIVLLGLVLGYGLAILGDQWTQNWVSHIHKVLQIGRLGAAPALRAIDVVYAVIAATIIWLLSTLIPASRIVKQDAAVVLAGSGKGVAVRSSKGAGILVGFQVVLSSLVLVLCATMALALNKETGKPTGLNGSQITMTVYPTIFDARYTDLTKRLRYWEDLKAAIESRIPGADVAFALAAPSRPSKIGASIETRQQAKNQGALRLPFSVVTDNYFTMLGLNLRSGRLFDNTDNSASLNVAIIDDELARRYWPAQDVLGKRVQLEDGVWVTVVGLVSSVAGGTPFRKDEMGVLYRPMRQAVPSEFRLLVRTPKTGADPRVALRAAAFAVDRDLPLRDLQTLDDYLAVLRFDYKNLIQLVVVFAIITAVIAATGLFGLISRSAVQRTQEVGIRRALGATSLQATSMLVRQGAVYLSMSVVGVGLGIMVMPLLSRTITNIMDYAIPVTLGVVLLMAGVIFTASYLPGRRAVALEPGDALRYE